MAKTIKETKTVSESFELLAEMATKLAKQYSENEKDENKKIKERDNFHKKSLLKNKKK